MSEEPTGKGLAKNDVPGKDLEPKVLVETLNKLIAAQTQDFELKTQQIEVEKQRVEIDKRKDDHAFEFGMASLGAQKADRTHSREISRKEKVDSYWLIFAILLLIVALIGFALYLDKDEIAKELVKAVLFITAGAVAGYGIAIKKKEPASGSDPNQGSPQT